MVKVRVHKIETMAFDVKTTAKHIEAGECRMASKCMEKVAIAETLFAMGGVKSDAEARVRVDAGHIRFNYGGFRWQADTPKIAKASLIKFDQKKEVEPHKYRVVARKVGKIQKITAARQEQINKARRKRITGGKPDRAPNRLTLRKRVVGFA